MKPPAIAVLAFATLLSGCAAPHRSGESLDMTHDAVRYVRAIGDRAVEEDGIVGLSIGIAIDGEIVFAEGFGHADAARSVPVTAETVYDVASVGKQFTAVAILTLAERGQLSLDQRVRSLVPGLPDDFPDATIEQLLRHTSGFVSGDLDELNPPADYARPRYGAELLTDVELQTGSTQFDEDETWVYSNAGYLVLGFVVEAVSGERYDRFIRREVLGLLGSHAMFVSEYPPESHGSQRLRRTPEGVAAVPYIDMSAWGGQGSINSNVVDLLRWFGALNRYQIISEPSLALMRSPSAVRGAHANAAVPYGIGQRLGELEGHRKVGHTGTFDGGSAALVYYPDHGLEIAVACNTRGHGAPHAHTYEATIAKHFLGLSDPDVAAQRVPVSESQRRAIEGRYSDGRIFTASIESDELVVVRNGEEVERLIHVGDMRFRNPGAPDVFEWFIMDGDRAGWWVYMMSGNYLEVLRRESADG